MKQLILTCISRGYIVDNGGEGVTTGMCDPGCVASTPRKQTKGQEVVSGNRKKTGSGVRKQKEDRK